MRFSVSAFQSPLMPNPFINPQQSSHILPTLSLDSAWCRFFSSIATVRAWSQVSTWMDMKAFKPGKDHVTWSASSYQSS